MKEAILEHHLDHDVRTTLGEVVSVNTRLVEGGQICDLDAPDPFERDHPRGRLLPEHPRDLDIRVVREVRRELLGVPCLAQVVELDLLHRPGPANLHDNLSPVCHRCRVSLPDRCSRQRLCVECCKHALRLAAELGADHLPNDLGGTTRRVVLQLGQHETAPVRLRLALEELA
jgi:hypothetical protein